MAINSDRKLEYLAEIVDRGKISNGMVPLLRLLTEHDINAELLQLAVEACGTPVIWNDFGNLSIPNTVEQGKPDLEIWALLANQSFYKRMSNVNQLVCPMFPICQIFTKDYIKNECYELPWQGPECIMTFIGGSLGLE